MNDMSNTKKSSSPPTNPRAFPANPSTPPANPERVQDMQLQNNTAAPAADSNPLLEPLLTTLSTSVTATIPLLQTAETPLLDRIKAIMAPLQCGYNMRLLTYVHDLEQKLAERTQELESSQEELNKMRGHWVDDYHLIRELRAAVRRATEESDVRYRENLATLRAGTIRENALQTRVRDLEREVERLRGGGGEGAAQDEAVQQPTVDEETGGAEEEGEGRNGPASGQRQQQQHAGAEDDDDEHSLRSVKRRKTAAAAQVPRVRSLFTKLHHQFDAPGFDAAADSCQFLLGRHSEREQVVCQLANIFEPEPAAVAAATTSQLATTLAQARDFLLARMQLKAEDGLVVVDLVPADVPAVRALDDHLADIICDQERARKSKRWVEGDVFPDYCFRGAVVARRKPNFDQGEGRACKECTGSGKPCIVRRRGQLVALPKKDPAKGSWKDADMWVGAHGEGFGGRKRKRKN